MVNAEIVPSTYSKYAHPTSSAGQRMQPCYPEAAPPAADTRAPISLPRLLCFSLTSQKETALFLRALQEKLSVAFRGLLMGRDV